MREKYPVFLVGAGATLGSCLTLALLKLFSRNKSFNNSMQGVPSIQYQGQEIDIVKNGYSTSPLMERKADTKAENNRFSDDLLKDEIVHEHLTRNIHFFGLESQQKANKAFVVVIGLGGVGSHAATMLLRSGVGRLRIVDFDQVSLSSLNRHAVATREDVGTSKALCLKKHFKSIFPESQVDARVQLYDASSEEEILGGQPDFVLDCIDNIDTKVRHRLRREHGIDGGISVVFSLEKPKMKLLPFKGPNEEKELPTEYQIVPGFRVRIIPVLGTIPAIFGQVMASHVFTQLSGFYIQTEPIVNFDLDHYCLLHQRLIECEETLYGTAMQVEVDVEEVVYIVKELWRGRSARDQTSRDVGRGMWRSVNTLTLTRWDRSKPASVTNLLLLKFKEAEDHDATTLDKLKKEEPMFYDMVTNVLERAARDFFL